MPRLNIFLKGNLDLRDSLHSLKLNGELKWNGINELVRARYPDTTVRLRHETWTRSDALLQSGGSVPKDLMQHDLPLGAYPAVSQFSQALFETKSDAIILSAMPDIANPLWRHKTEGYLIFTNAHEIQAPEQKQWLRTCFDRVSLLDVDQSMDNFSRIIDRCQVQADAPILIYNVSSVVPSDSIHCFLGLEDSLSTRIKRFNLGLIELSQKKGISIVDVDTILARHGTDHLKIDTLHLNGDGCRLIAEEVVRILDDLGCL
ncbi:MAG: SGNH/GDSL hydrolase family protein [Rhizobiales bacterium]|nr:SGNH/GDSL hydrolase family protein [Hyphomicrobiales bacterium]